MAEVTRRLDALAAEANPLVNARTGKAKRSQRDLADLVGILTACATLRTQLRTSRASEIAELTDDQLAVRIAEIAAKARDLTKPGKSVQSLGAGDTSVSDTPASAREIPRAEPDCEPARKRTA